MSDKWQVGPVKLANGCDAIIHRFCEKRQRYIGEIQDGSGGWFAREWEANGWYCFGDKAAENPFNLAPPPKKKVRVRMCINCYGGGAFHWYRSRQDADECQGSDRIACKEIDIEVEEGEGL